MNKIVKNNLSVSDQEIILQNDQLYYSPVGLSRLLVIPVEISEVIINSSEDCNLEGLSGQPKRYLAQKHVDELQDPSYRWILDMTAMIFPFNHKLACAIASYLPTFGESVDFCFDGDFHLKALWQAHWDDVRSSINLGSIVRTINPDIPMPMMSEGLMKTSQVAEIIGLSETSVRKLVKDGKLQYTRSKGATGHYRFSAEQISQYLSNAEAGSDK